MEEDVASNAVREESVKDETSCAILDHSSGPDDLTWNEETPYLKITDDSTIVCKTPVASLTPVATPEVDAMLSPPESLGNKKQCWETMAERLLKSTEIGEPDYKDAPLVRYTRPDRSLVIPWICSEAQSMMEPPWYVTAMFVWFRRWRIRSGSWPSLPQSDFALDQETIDTVDLHLAPSLAKMHLSMGELQALKVLTMLQCLAKIGPQKPAQGMISHCVESIMRQLMVLDITFSSQAVLGSTVLTWSRSTSFEMDVSLADISSLPSSVGSAEDMHRCERQDSEADMEIATSETRQSM